MSRLTYSSVTMTIDGNPMTTIIDGDPDQEPPQVGDYVAIADGTNWQGYRGVVTEVDSPGVYRLRMDDFQGDGTRLGEDMYYLVKDGDCQVIRRKDWRNTL